MNNDEEVLKAREARIESLNFFLRNYNTLICSGYRKSVLDKDIAYLVREIKQLNKKLY